MMKAKELKGKIKNCLDGNYLVTQEQLDTLEKVVLEYAKQEYHSGWSDCKAQLVKMIKGHKNQKFKDEHDQ